MTHTKTCFLIDDDHDDQLIFTLALKDLHHPMLCITADSGVEALRRLDQREFSPDFIFVDLNMPGMNGKECVLELRSRSALKEVPVVIYTTSRKQKDMQEAHDLGAAAYITKPYLISDLSKALKDFFSHRLR